MPPRRLTRSQPTTDEPKRRRKAQDLTPTGPVIVSLIRTGEYDSFIRAIARACFLRREDLTGSVFVEADNPDMTPAVNTGQSTPTPTAQAAAAGMPTPTPLPPPPARSGAGLPLSNYQKMYEHFMSASSTDEIRAGTLQPVPMRKRLNSSVRVIRFRGKRYYYASLVGKWFYFPRHFVPQSLQGKRVGIIGASDKKLKLLIVDQPSNSRGDSMKMWLNKEPFWVSKNPMFGYLTGQSEDDED